MRVEAGRDHLRAQFVPVGKGHPGCPPVPHQHPCDRSARADLGPRLAGRGRDRLRHGSGAALREAPRPEVPVDLPHVVVEQHVRGPRRTRPEEGADDPARGQRGLQHVGLEPLLEEVGRAHGHQLGEKVELVGLQAQEVASEAKHAGHVAGSEAGGVGRDDVEEVLHGARHVEERAAVVVVGLGVADREAGDLAPGAVVVGVAVEAVAVRQGGEGALEGQDREPVAGQIQLADDVGAHQAYHVREDAVLEAGEDLLGDGGAADERTCLEHAHVEAGAREVGGVDQAVVAAADDDDVVSPGHRDQRLFVKRFHKPVARVMAAHGVSPASAPGRKTVS